jgi:drug/metabolite transporter (DMT)-like permease
MPGGGKLDRTTLLAFSGTVLIGAVNVVAVRFSNREFAPFWGATLRFAGSAIILMAIASALRRPFPRGRSLAGAIVYGILAFGASYGLFYWGTQRVTAGFAAVLMGTTPLLAFLLSAAHGTERFRWQGLAGGVLAVIGIAAIASDPPGEHVSIAFMLAIVASAACSAESTIVVKIVPKADVVTFNAVAMSIGATLLLGLSLIRAEPWRVTASASTWTALAYLIVASPLLFILYVFVIRRWTPSAASYQFVLFPPISIVLGALLAGESVTPWILLGTPLVLAGVYVGALSKQREGYAAAT